MNAFRRRADFICGIDARVLPSGSVENLVDDDAVAFDHEL
jgi:hypothetical protein